jgi:hypothetical protein
MATARGQLILDTLNHFCQLLRIVSSNGSFGSFSAYRADCWIPSGQPDMLDRTTGFDQKQA